MGKHHKKFDIHCDYCGEVTDNYNVFNDWQEFESDAISLKVCKKCQIEEELRRRHKNIDKNIDKSVDKRNSVWYNVVNKLRKGS